MELVVAPDGRALAELIADRMAQWIGSHVRTTLGVATGSSPLGVYRALSERVAGGLDVSGVSAFALDEYVGLGAEHPQSYAATLQRTFAGPLGLRPGALHVPDAAADDLDLACREYERAIRDAGGVDIQLAGIGANGHLAFNEPGSPEDSTTRVVELAPRTRADNARFFAVPGDVPTRAITQGVSTILRARSLVVVVTGEAKAAALADAFRGPIGPQCPASFLRRHPDVTVYADPAATALLDATASATAAPTTSGGRAG